MLDSRLNYKQIESNLKVDIIWLHDNPTYKPNNLCDHVDFKTLLIDANNKAYKTAEYENFGKFFDKNTIDLKKQGALVVDLQNRNE